MSPSEIPPANQPPGAADPAPSVGRAPASIPGGAATGRSRARSRRRGRGRTILRAGLLIVLAGLVVAVGVVAWGLRRLSDITVVDVAGVEPADGPVNNWLLIGTDGREGINPDEPDAAVFLGEQVVGKRTDTIMVARIDSSSRTVDLLSIPRDLWVPIAGRDGNGRINGAYNGDDGRERLVATIAAALGLEINHYAEVNFVGFREIVDALEGVPLWFPHPARDTGSGLHIAEAGCHILDGGQALAYARARTYEELVDGEWRRDPTGDLGRTARQRTFLSRTIDTATGKLDVTSLGTVNQVLAVGGRNLLVEDGASVTDLLSLARTFAAVGGDRIVGHTLPVEDFRTAGGAQVLRLREGEAAAVLDGFRTGTVAAGPAATEGGGTEPVDDTGAAESPDEVGGQAAEAIIDSGTDGYGRFGFIGSATPDGTPCT